MAADTPTGPPPPDDDLPPLTGDAGDDSVTDSDLMTTRLRDELADELVRRSGRLPDDPDDQELGTQSYIELPPLPADTGGPGSAGGPANDPGLMPDSGRFADLALPAGGGWFDDPADAPGLSDLLPAEPAGGPDYGRPPAPPTSETVDLGVARQADGGSDIFSGPPVVGSSMFRDLLGGPPDLPPDSPATTDGPIDPVRPEDIHPSMFAAQGPAQADDDDPAPGAQTTRLPPDELPSGDKSVEGIFAEMAKAGGLPFDSGSRGGNRDRPSDAGAGADGTPDFNQIDINASGSNLFADSTMPDFHLAGGSDGGYPGDRPRPGGPVSQAQIAGPQSSIFADDLHEPHDDDPADGLVDVSEIPLMGSSDEPTEAFPLPEDAFGMPPLPPAARRPADDGHVGFDLPAGGTASDLAEVSGAIDWTIPPGDGSAEMTALSHLEDDAPADLPPLSDLDEDDGRVLDELAEATASRAHALGDDPDDLDEYRDLVDRPPPLPRPDGPSIDDLTLGDDAPSVPGPPSVIEPFSNPDEPASWPPAGGSRVAGGLSRPGSGELPRPLSGALPRPPATVTAPRPTGGSRSHVPVPSGTRPPSSPSGFPRPPSTRARRPTSATSLPGGPIHTRPTYAVVGLGMLAGVAVLVVGSAAWVVVQKMTAGPPEVAVERPTQPQKPAPIPRDPVRPQTTSQTNPPKTAPEPVAPAARPEPEPLPVPVALAVEPGRVAERLRDATDPAKVAIRGQGRLFDRVRRDAPAGGAIAATDPDLVAAAKDLEEAADKAAGWPAANAALHLGLLKELTGDRAGAEKVYEKGLADFKGQPAIEAVFGAALARLKATAPAAPGRADARPARRLLWAAALAAVLLQPPADAADAPPDEPGFEFWQAVAAAAAGDYAEAVRAIDAARAKHERRRLSLLGRGVNPATDPLEQIFTRTCDDLKRYWQLRQQIAELSGAAAGDDLAAVKRRLADGDDARQKLQAANQQLADRMADLKAADDRSEEVKGRLDAAKATLDKTAKELREAGLLAADDPADKLPEAARRAADLAVSADAMKAAAALSAARKRADDLESDLKAARAKAEQARTEADRAADEVGKRVDEAKADAARRLGELRTRAEAERRALEAAAAADKQKLAAQAEAERQKLAAQAEAERQKLAAQAEAEKRQLEADLNRKVQDARAERQDALAALAAQKEEFARNLAEAQSGARVPVTDAVRAIRDRASRTFGAGVSAYLSGRHLDAERLLTDAVTDDPQDARYWYYLGLARLALGRSAEADEALRKGADQERRNRPPTEVVGESLERVQGPARRAVSAYRPY